MKPLMDTFLWICTLVVVAITVACITQVCTVAVTDTQWEREVVARGYGELVITNSESGETEFRWILPEEPAK